MVCPVPLGKKEDCGERYIVFPLFQLKDIYYAIGRRVDTSAGAVTTTSLDLSLWRNYAVALASPSHVTCRLSRHLSLPLLLE